MQAFRSHGKPVFLTLLACAALALFAAEPAAAGHGVPLQASYSNLDRTVIEYALPGYAQDTVVIEGKEYQRLSLDGEGYFRMDLSGQPQLPVVRRSIMLPDTGTMELRVLEGRYEEIENVDLAPYRGPITRKVDPASVPYRFGEVYGKNAWFPGTPAVLQKPYILHDVRGAVVELRPFQYNPVKKVLRVYKSLEVEVVKTGPGGENVIDRTVYAYKPDRSFEAIYKSQFMNYAGNRTEPPSEDGEMLIISYGPFMAAMQPFVDWKNSIGIPTSIVDVATIGNNFTAIKNYITNVYNSTNLSYVLLVGDVAQVKSGYFSGGLSDPAYSCITSDWYPDLFVGRFSAQNVNQVTTQVDRTLQYEQQSHDVHMGDWNARGLAVASDQGPGHYNEYDNQHEDLISNELLAYGFTKVSKSYDPWGTKAKVAAAINEGVRCVHYTGHGWEGGWGNGGAFSTNDVYQLNNTGMLPFISSVACSVGDFSAGECFCEAWQRATKNGQPIGAVANYGSTIGQYWDEPMYGQGNHGYNGKYGGAERFWMEINWSVCGMWFGGSCIMMDICGANGRDMFMTWTCFGDPSVRITGQAGEKTLTADGWSLPINTPVDIHFTLAPGASYAGHNYVLLAGVTGTYPGTDIPGGVHVPLNFDFFTFFAIENANALPLFQNFLGVLDASGEGHPVFSTNGLTPIDPRYVGLKLYFAGVTWPQGETYEFASNPLTLTIVN